MHMPCHMPCHTPYPVPNDHVASTLRHEHQTLTRPQVVLEGFWHMLQWVVWRNTGKRPPRLDQVPQAIGLEVVALMRVLVEQDERLAPTHRRSLPDHENVFVLPVLEH